MPVQNFPPLPSTRPEDLEAVLQAFQLSRILLTALELDLFSAIAHGATSSDIAAQTNTDPHALSTLLNALVALGFAQKSEGAFSNTDFGSRYLTAHSAESIRDAMLHHAYRWNTWSHLTQRVRGETLPEDYEGLTRERYAALLARQDRRARVRAPLFVDAIGTSGVSRILDLGAGSGAYSIAFCQASDAISADILELPSVAPITQGYVHRAGLADRIRIRGANLQSEPLGSGYDLILLFSLTHLLDPAQNQQLLTRCAAALNPGGRVAIHDHLLAEDGVAPVESVLFSLNALVSTQGGRTYPASTYDEWLANAGFEPPRRFPVSSQPTVLQVARLRA